MTGCREQGDSAVWGGHAIAGFLLVIRRGAGLPH